MDTGGLSIVPYADFLSRHSGCSCSNMAEGQGQYYDPAAIALTGREDGQKICLPYLQAFTVLA